MDKLHDYLRFHSMHYHTNQGITVLSVSDMQQGVAIAKELVYEVVSKKTVLYLSGGKTPQSLYTQFAQEKKIDPGAVGVVDERFGLPLHDNSNEKMFQDTGLLAYLHKKKIPFYPIITRKQASREATALQYDEKVRELNAAYPQSVAIMGIGTDGHTSSIAPNRPGAFVNPFFSDENKHMWVASFADPNSFYGERIGMTFLGISFLDIIIVLAFGDDKQFALTQLFESGDAHLIPARVFTSPDIAHKTMLITDQNVSL